MKSRRGFGVWEAGEIPAFGLMELQGWVGLGRMEPVVLGKGAVLAVPALVETPIAVENHEDGGSSSQEERRVTQTPKATAREGLEDRLHWE